MSHPLPDLGVAGAECRPPLGLDDHAERDLHAHVILLWLYQRCHDERTSRAPSRFHLEHPPPQPLMGAMPLQYQRSKSVPR